MLRMTHTHWISIVFLLATNIVLGQSWQKMSDFPGADRDDGLALSNGEKAIFFSGNTAGIGTSNEVYVYVVDSNSWRTSSGFPGASRQYAGGFVIGDTAYVLAGFGINGGRNDFWAFDLVSETWTQKSDLPFSKRWSFACFAALERGFVVGGTNGSERNDEVWMFQPETQTWTQRGSFPGGPRRELVVGVSRNKAYIGLGYDDFNNGEFFNDWWKYETIQDEWTKLSNYPVDALGWAEGLSGPSYVAIVGGSGASGLFTNESYWFDVAEESWSEMPKMLVEGYRGCSSFETGEHVYVLSGFLENTGRKTDLFRIAYPEQTAYRPFAFPNPARGVSQVYVPEFSTLHLYNINGKIIETHETTQAGYIDLEQHQPGVYYVRVASEYTLSPTITLIYY